jgi:hypothetical protein
MGGLRWKQYRNESRPLYFGRSGFATLSGRDAREGRFLAARRGMKSWMRSRRRENVTRYRETRARLSARQRPSARCGSGAADVERRGERSLRLSGGVGRVTGWSPSASRAAGHHIRGKGRRRMGEHLDAAPAQSGPAGSPSRLMLPARGQQTVYLNDGAHPCGWKARISARTIRLKGRSQSAGRKRRAR